MYRDANCWESYPGAGDAQCAAKCVTVTAKNGSTFYPYVGRLRYINISARSSLTRPGMQQLLSSLLCNTHSCVNLGSVEHKSGSWEHNRVHCLNVINVTAYIIKYEHRSPHERSSGKDLGWSCSLTWGRSSCTVVIRPLICNSRKTMVFDDVLEGYACNRT